MSQSLSNLPIGAKVKFGSHSIYEETAQPIQWLVVTKNTTSNGVNSRPANSVTLYARYVIDCRAFDAKEPNNPNSNRQSYGNNRYIYSNIAQWLNSSAERGKWYSPQHTYDNSPNSLCVDRSAEYDWKEGFLYNFTESERNAILLTTIATTKSSSDGSGDDISTAKVFLPSYSREIAQWDYTTGGGDITSKLSQQVKDYSKATTRHETSWTRDARVSTTDKVDILGVDGKLGTGGVGAEAYCSVWGVRPVLNLPANQVVSDTTDSDGCYTVIFNKLPIASGMYATTTSVNALLGGKANKFSLTAYDSDGAVIRYEVECLDNGVWKNIYTGTQNEFTYLVEYGLSTMTCRFRVVDNNGDYSEYSEELTFDVFNYEPPEISGTDSNLGLKEDGFTIDYSVFDHDGQSVTIEEAIDGVPIRTFVKDDYTIDFTANVTGTTWLTIGNGTHTLTITARDEYDVSVRTYTFSKSVDKIFIQNNNPMLSTSKPSRISIIINRNIPTDAIFKVEVCNNGYDSNPTWEDATESVIANQVHIFTNESKTAMDWGVSIRVTVERNGSSGACYINSIGGNFE